MSGDDPTGRPADIGQTVPHRDCTGNNFVVFVVGFAIIYKNLFVINWKPLKDCSVISIQ
jgi:hypothetical protein